MKSTITSLNALEILDSRGNPTVRVFMELEDGTRVCSSVPSGSSTGENEAVELRDGDNQRYRGQGVLKAVEHVTKNIAPIVIGQDATEQAKIDQLMIELDGTKNKSQLGANAILGVSMAACKAAAQSHGLELFRYINSSSRRLPVPCLNILNGGKHANNNVDFQEFMIVPHGARSFSEGLRYADDVFYSLEHILKTKQYSTAKGDEGGFAPNLKSNEEAIELIVEAIILSGYQPGNDISIAIDSAATSFSPRKKEYYHLAGSGIEEMTSDMLITLAKEWVEKYPIILWEDPLAEEDWSGFKKFTEALGDKIEVVGDDIFVTNVQYIQRGIEEHTANAALIKLNQIGTVTETINAINLCIDNGWRAFASHRSGETEDVFLADFAMAMGVGHFKSGSLSRSERVAKYNRLLEIEMMLAETSEYYWKRN